MLYRFWKSPSHVVDGRICYNKHKQEKKLIKPINITTKTVIKVLNIGHSRVKTFFHHKNGEYWSQTAFLAVTDSFLKP